MAIEAQILPLAVERSGFFKKQERGVACFGFFLVWMRANSSLV